MIKSTTPLNENISTKSNHLSRFRHHLNWRKSNIINIHFAPHRSCLNTSTRQPNFQIQTPLLQSRQIIPTQNRNLLSNHNLSSIDLQDQLACITSNCGREESLPCFETIDGVGADRDVALLQFSLVEVVAVIGAGADGDPDCIGADVGYVCGLETSVGCVVVVDPFPGGGGGVGDAVYGYFKAGVSDGLEVGRVEGGNGCRGR